MLRNYFNIASRNLLKYKGYSFINIFGLAVGIASCILIFMYVKDEVSFDKYHANTDNIYRIISKLDFGGNEMTITATNRAEAKIYTERIPEVKDFVRMNSINGIIQKGDDYISEFNMVYADPTLFEVFDFKPLYGNLSDALSELNSIVITEEIALKYFQKVDVVGDELSINLNGSTENYVIDAVIDNLPSNSSFYMEFILPWSKYDAASPFNMERVWTSIGIGSFLLLQEGADPEVVAQKIKDIRVEFNPGEDGEFARGIDNWLQPLTDIHLNTDFSGQGDGIRGNSDPTFSYILSGIALVILVLACINFANITVARSLPRAKEIGVRKVLGAVKNQITFQFLLEALLVSIIAFILGLIVAELFLPIFGELLNKEFSGNVLQDFGLVLSCFVLVILTALIAGSYPAFVISGFSAISSLNGKVKLSNKRYVSKGLVLIQFSLAGILVAGTIAMNQQIDFMVDYDLGYDDENLIVLDLPENGKLSNVLIQELNMNPNVEAAIRTRGYGSASVFDYEGTEFTAITSHYQGNFLELMDIELLKGRELKEGQDNYIMDNDTLQNIVVNQSFLDQAGIEGDPIGVIIGDGGGEPQIRIVGQVEEFNYGNAKSDAGSLAFFAASNDDRYNQIYLKYNPTQETIIMDEVSKAWKEVYPYYPVNADFVKERNLLAFQEEERWKSVITDSSILAIIISCLGLFGLSHLAGQQREKEIGVRKVLGASVAQLVVLLNSGFSKLVMLSVLIMTPVSYYLIDNWLDNFANQMSISPVTFLVPAFITLGIATLTISLQSMRTARANPVDSLRNE